MMNCFEQIESMRDNCSNESELAGVCDYVYHMIGSEIARCYSSDVDFLYISSDFIISKMLSSGCDFGFPSYTNTPYTSGQKVFFGDSDIAEVKFFECTATTDNSPTENGTIASGWKSTGPSLQEIIRYISSNSKTFDKNLKLENGFNRNCDRFKYTDDGIIFTYTRLLDVYPFAVSYSASSFEEYLNKNNIYDKTRKKLIVAIQKESQYKAYSPSAVEDISSKVAEIIANTTGTNKNTLKLRTVTIFPYLSSFVSYGDYSFAKIVTVSKRYKLVHKFMRAMFPSSIEESSYNSLPISSFDDYNSSYFINATPSVTSIIKNDRTLLTSSTYYLTGYYQYNTSKGYDNTHFQLNENEPLYNALCCRGYETSSYNYVQLYGFIIDRNTGKGTEYLLGGRNSNDVASIDNCTRVFVNIALSSDLEMTAFVRQISSDYYTKSDSSSGVIKEVYKKVTNKDW